MVKNTDLKIDNINRRKFAKLVASSTAIGGVGFYNTAAAKNKDEADDVEISKEKVKH